MSVRLFLRKFNHFRICVRFASQFADFPWEEDDTSIPRITVPTHWIQLAEKKQQRHRERLAKYQQKYGVDRRKMPLALSFRPRTEFNHYFGQRYPAGAHDMHLGTQFWDKCKYKGYSMTILPHRKSAAYDFDIRDHAVSFSELGLEESIVQVLESLGLKTPTVVQSDSIRCILSGQHTFVGAQTGTGKTVAFAAPIIQKIREAKLQNINPQIMDNSLVSPYGVIIAPSVELCEQLKATISFVSLESVKVAGSRELSSDIDLLVITPGELLKRKLDWSRLKHVVLDEADTLTDDSFVQQIMKFLKTIQFRISSAEGAEIPGAQLILAAATVPSDIEEFFTYLVHSTPVEYLIPEVRNLHKVHSHVRQVFMRVRAQDKPEHLVRLCRRDVALNKQTLIFCKNQATVQFVHHMLIDAAFDAAKVHARLDIRERKRNYELFATGQCPLLVATDHASRGLDTVNVSHIINYDFPSFLSDYVHRSGRVGRVGSDSKAVVTSFVRSPKDVRLVTEIERSVRFDEELPIDPNAKRQYAETAERMREMRNDATTRNAPVDDVQD